ncbi:MAG: DUF4190 domain-containing protein [Anaerolineales bacterium]|nr:DUF4190 domain-containing protein [Anaerolineales bacterium]
MRMPTGTPPAAASSGTTNDMALASLLAGGVTWVVGWCGGWFLGWFLPGANLCTGLIGLITTIVGIYTGHQGLSQTRPGSPEADSRWMAITGLVLNYVSLALLVLGLCALTVLFLIFGAAIFSSADWSQLISATPVP